MEQKFPKIIIISVTILFAFQLSGCGTILYPERRGLKSGHLDSGVVILDAIGLLFFLIPGIIAFAVDFSNGTIYLPASTVIIKSKADLKQIEFDPKNTSIAEIEKIIKDQTGRSVKLTQGNMRVSRLTSTDEMMVNFAQAAQTNQIALVQ